MGGLSLWHWLVVAGVVAILFGGGGKLSGLMGDFAKGIKAFKSGMKDEEVAATTPAEQLSPPASPTVAAIPTAEHSTAQHG